jgi:5,10-methylene-tetrahydrofolate dehydrogenase/methenyl tetrahydrofolate cyclohydrolase
MSTLNLWREKASRSPVPGGVGPLTIALLLANTLKAYKRFSDSHSRLYS